MLWARMLAYITGTVDQELLLRNEYLAAENRILRACANRNADGRSAKPVEQGENQIDAPDQGQRWNNDADRERIESQPSPERETCNHQHAKAVAKVEANPSSPHVRAPTR